MKVFSTKSSLSSNLQKNFSFKSFLFTTRHDHKMSHSDNIIVIFQGRSINILGLNTRSNRESIKGYKDNYVSCSCSERKLKRLQEALEKAGAKNVLQGNELLTGFHPVGGSSPPIPSSLIKIIAEHNTEHLLYNLHKKSRHINLFYRCMKPCWQCNQQH